MASINPVSSLRDYQAFVKEVYGLSNDRNFSLPDMVTNIERFLMRGLKGIRKSDSEKVKLNLIISISWFMSFMNQLHIDLEDSVWRRFPYQCSYCASLPCACRAKKVQTRQRVKVNNRLRPKTLAGFQQMFADIYPPSLRTAEQAGVHLAEEVGELSEALLVFRGGHEEDDFQNVILEASDMFSCYMGVFNSLSIDWSKELVRLFSRNCHVCKKAPCVCTYTDIMKIKT